ncbi:MAG: hypothetical protein JXA41_07620 [Deltaproteobacteria bacterium]|nr:hypothetical protein [Deltaproteobacteria bacterium]
MDEVNMSHRKEDMINTIINTLIEIPHSAEDKGKIIEAINDIAYQANLLALSMAAKRFASEEPLHDIR